MGYYKFYFGYHNHFFNYFITDKLSSPAQYGFIKDNLVIDLISENENRNTNTKTDIIMIKLDFSKASDKVSHLKIDSILQGYQVDTNTKIVNFIISPNPTNQCCHWSTIGADYKFLTFLTIRFL